MGLASLLVLWAVPGFGYVVVLKGGEQITTTKKYERQGKNVILTLPNGVTASYLASDVDFAKTDELNASANLSNARILDTGNVREVEARQRQQEPDKTTFTDLLSNRKKLAMPKPQSRRPTAEDGSVVPELPTTKAGFVDLMTLRRDPHDNSELVSGIIGYLNGQGNEVKVYQGSRPGWPLVEITAASEASVFKAIRDASSCLVQVQPQFSQLGGFELLIVTDTRVRGGQFSLTQELANELLTGRLETPSFFLRYVEF